MAHNNITIQNKNSSNTDDGVDYLYVDGPYDFFTDGGLSPSFYPENTEWEAFFRGYFTFFIAIVIIISNTFLVMVFVRRTKLTQTTFLLSALAISDVISSTTRLPEAIYFYMARNYEYYIPYHWCVANRVLSIMYLISDFSFNWITALLGCQRCLSVCLPLKFKRICTMRNTIIAVGLIFGVSILQPIFDIVVIEIEELKIWTAPDYNVALPSGCLRFFSRTLVEQAGDENKLVISGLLFSGLIIQIIPVVILSVATVILAYFLHKKSSMFKTKDSSVQNSKDVQYKRITWITFIIMIVFLVAEIQDGIVDIIDTYDLSENKVYTVLSGTRYRAWFTISYTLSLLGHACIFWIFFFMSQQFRTALTEMVTSPFKREQKAPTEMALNSKENIATEMALDSKENIATEMALDSKENIATEMALDSKENIATEMALDSKENIATEMAPDSKENIATEMALDSKENISTENALDSKENISMVIIKTKSLAVGKERSGSTSI